MTLLDKVKELQNIKPPLDGDEINRRVQEWKKQSAKVLSEKSYSEWFS